MRWFKNSEVISSIMAEPGYEARKKAENQRASHNIDGAIETLEAYLYTDPHNCKVRMDLARLYIIEKDNKDFGLVQLDAILDIDPDYDDARKALVSVLKNNKKYNDETKKHFDILLPKYPDDMALLHTYGTFCREQLLDFEVARKAFETCVDREPRNVIYRLSLASVLINDLRMYDTGREHLLVANELQPGNKKTADALKRLQKKKFQGDKGPKKGFLTRFVK